MRDHELFASIQLFRSYNDGTRKPMHVKGNPATKKDVAAVQQRAKEVMSFLFVHFFLKI